MLFVAIFPFCNNFTCRWGKPRIGSMRVEKFVWDSKKYGIGHELIDHHHQVLMEIVNELIELSEKESTSKGEYIQLLMKMSDYSHYHFKAEEGLLNMVDYPEFEKQHDEHLAFSERASRLVTSCDLKQLSDTAAFLRRWLEEHILVEDMKFKTYL